MGKTKKPEDVSVAVIGAGLAGLTCARLLRDRGLSPVVFEKSRGLGGRLATRRTRDGLAFDHGAQFVTARSGAFREFLRQAAGDGAAALWHPDGLGSLYAAPQDWTVGAPGMNALAKPLAEGIDVRLSTPVSGVTRHDKGWHIAIDGDPDDLLFDYLISTVPAPQAAALLQAEPEVAAALAGVSMAPCWALLTAFPARIPAPFDVRRDAAGELAWVARSSSKPGRDAQADCWVAHASPAWSRQHLEEDREQIADEMLDMLSRVLGVDDLPQPVYTAAHRWRYALTTAELGQPYLGLPDRRLYLGGDWCLGARVEYAFESGRAIAAAVSEEVTA